MHRMQPSMLPGKGALAGEGQPARRTHLPGLHVLGVLLHSGLQQPPRLRSVALPLLQHRQSLWPEQQKALSASAFDRGLQEIPYTFFRPTIGTGGGTMQTG